MTTPDWQAETYHRVSEPQWMWGQKVLADLALEGDETVLDAGCGTGRLTALVLERLPRGRAIALDASPAMLDVARRELARFGDRVEYLQADLGALALDGVADVVFSTATFHWVKDHEALFRGLARALRPGGRLHAQCGGAGNLDRSHARAHALMGESPFAPYFAGWQDPWNFAGPELSGTRLRASGFVEIKAWIEPAPTRFADAAAYQEFVRTVILRHHLAALPPALQQRFLDLTTEAAAQDDPPFTLDYVRLNLRARRP
jgi:trans-aconitate 2-methyltransferase